MPKMVSPFCSCIKGLDLCGPEYLTLVSRYLLLMEKDSSCSVEVGSYLALTLTSIYKIRA